MEKIFDFYHPLIVPPTRPAIEFGVSIRVQMSDFENWQADQLRAFWKGVGDIVIASKPA